MLKNKSAVIAAAATMTAMAGGGTLLAVPASAGTQVPLAGSWHVVKTVSGPNFPEFTAVTAASGRNAWAFESATASNARPQAFEMRGGKWLSKPFPGLAGESVLSASASSITNVWAVTTNFIKGHSRILRFNGDSWAQVRSFSREAGSVLALRNTDVWLFGTAFSAATQAVHYNGHAWTASRGSRGLLGGSALSASSIWAYGQTSVSHWNGSKWTAASVKKLLPKNTELCGSRLTGIEAVAAKSVFAIGTGGCQDQLGPFVLLHFNGSKWSRIALKPSLGAPEAVAPDGRGGIWITVSTGSPPSGSMEHYSHGKLTSVTLPFTPAHLVLFGVATGRGTTKTFAVGFSRKSFSAGNSTAVVLRFGS